MDQDYQRYLNSYVRWSKFFCDVVCWFAVGFLASVILEFYVTYETCNVLNTGLSGETIENTEAAQAMSQELCSARIGFHSWAIAWLVYPVLRIPFLIRQSGPMMKIMGLRFVRENGQKWTLMNVVTYGFIEWLPAFLGALYVLLVGFTFSLFAGTVYFTIVIGAQLIWLAPVLFIRNGRNLAEIITGITVRATDKKLKKIERGYYSKFYYSVNKFMFGLTWVFYFLVLGICTFSFIQILRVPPQNPAYQEMVYGGYNLVWENNIYFAMAGVSAPADVTDFYQYGFRKSYGYFKYYESLKREMGIKTPYLNEIPKLKGLSFGIDQDREFKLFEQKTKNFECLWALEPKITPDCATFADWLAFIEKNKIVWDRYNRVPDMGTVYVTPPAILGGNIRNIANLGGLKNVHIIYLAKNGKPDEAMKEWLRYMKLYRMMANDREMIVFKALIAVNIGRHLSVLEHLLTIAPELAAKYESNIIQVLNNDQPIYRDPSLLSDDWGLIEPFAGGGIGNVNAIQNDLFECFLSAKKLAETSYDQFLYGQKNIPLCPLKERNLKASTFDQAFVHPVLTPGNYFPNVIYGLVIGGFLKVDELISSMKLTRVKFRQAQLGVQILARQIPASGVPEFVKSVPDDFQNPITRQPFDWDSEKQKLSFTVKGKEKDITTEFSLNIPK